MDKVNHSKKVAPILQIWHLFIALEFFGEYPQNQFKIPDIRLLFIPNAPGGHV